MQEPAGLALALGGRDMPAGGGRAGADTTVSGGDRVAVLVDAVGRRNALPVVLHLAQVSDATLILPRKSGL